MDDWIDYEAFVFAAGGCVACPECGMGILIASGSEAAQKLVCDVCDEVFETAGDG